MGQFGVIEQWPNVKDKRLSRTFEHESLNSYKQLHTVTFDHLLKGNKRAYIRRKIKCQFWEKEQYLFLKSQGFERADWTLKITSFNPTILGHKILSFWESLKYVFCLDWQFHPEAGRLQLKVYHASSNKLKYSLAGFKGFWWQRFVTDVMIMLVLTFWWENECVGDFLVKIGHQRHQLELSRTFYTLYRYEFY